jgi:hypothetical protein
MCQCDVERAIGKLVTDEGLRRRFAADPAATLRGLVAVGFELTPCELQALAVLDPRRLAHFANQLDARIQKVELPGGPPS